MKDHHGVAPNVVPIGSQADQLRLPEIVAYVEEHRERDVLIANGSILPLRTWVEFGSHIGIVVAHSQRRARAQIVFERHASGWGPKSTPAHPGAVVRPVSVETWSHLLSHCFPDGFPVARIRQENGPTALFPDPTNCRGFIIGTSGSGKSTAINSVLTAWRNRIHALGLSPEERPALVCFDPDGDYLGRTRDSMGRQRPNLLDCLREEPVVLRAGDLTCKATDLPAKLLMESLGRLSAPQKRWQDIYITSDESYEPLKHLIYTEYERDWPKHFAELTVEAKADSRRPVELDEQGSARPRRELPKQILESLTTLRAKLIAFLSPPLFALNGESTWEAFLTHFRNGRAIIIDISSFPTGQQPALITLILKILKREGEIRDRKALPLKPGLVVIDEYHLLEDAAKRAVDMFFLRGRKHALGMWIGTQRSAHISRDALSQSNLKLVLQLQAGDLRHAVDNCIELRTVSGEISYLSPGEGVLVARNVALPVFFPEPPIFRRRSRPQS